MADQEVENGRAEKVITQAKCTVASDFFPVIGVEASKLQEAVQFYKEVFGAVEVEPLAEPRRKDDLEQPLLQVLLQFCSGKVLVSDLLEDELMAQQSCSFHLMTEGDVQALIKKVVAAGGNTEGVGRSPFVSGTVLVLNHPEDELKAQQLVTGGDVEGVTEDLTFPGKQCSGKVKDPYGVVWTIVGKKTIDGDVAEVGGEVAVVGGDVAVVGGEVAEVGGDVALVGGEVAVVGGDVEPVIRIIVLAVDAEIGKYFPVSIKLFDRRQAQLLFTADLRNIQELASTLKCQDLRNEPVSLVVADLDMLYDCKSSDGKIARRSKAELDVFYGALGLLTRWSIVAGLITHEAGSRPATKKRRKSNTEHFVASQARTGGFWRPVVVHKPMGQNEADEMVDDVVRAYRAYMGGANAV